MPSLALYTITLFLFAFGDFAIASSYLVNTTIGLLQGFSPYPGVAAYLGVPYAEPPVGELRFAPPQPFHPSRGIPIDATELSAACFQVTYLSFAADRQGGVAESEDCLSINIWKPINVSKPLPVLVYLYGGGFASGANSLPQTDGRRFVSEQKDIIFISINYRVNIFGFPNSPAIPRKNLGLLDQRLGLEWVRDNVAVLGGDASRITLMGHSAGSISAAMVPFVYAQDPIVGALIELSGQPGLLPGDDGSSWGSVAAATGCKNEDSQAEVECLKKLPARALKRAISPANLVSLEDPVAAGGPVIDNVTVISPQEIAVRGSRGDFAKLPLLVTHTTHESDGVLPFSPTDGVNTTMSDAFTLASQQCPVALTASHWAANGVPTFRYAFDGAFAATKPYPWVRAYHGADNNLIFSGETTFAWEDPDETVIKAGRYLRKAIASFVRDPTSGLEAQMGWPRYNESGDTLVWLFANDSANVEFRNVREYDAPCAQLQ